MKKDFCDICGKEIETPGEGSRYKIKKEHIGWDWHYWERLHVHNDCWRSVCRCIRDRRADNGN